MELCKIIDEDIKDSCEIELLFLFVGILETKLIQKTQNNKNWSQLIKTMLLSFVGTNHTS